MFGTTPILVVRGRNFIIGKRDRGSRAHRGGCGVVQQLVVMDSAMLYRTD